MNTDDVLCPFSKAIIGQWCACSHAILAERCAGKMICNHSLEGRTDCHELVSQLKLHSRFILGLSDKNTELSHMQSMKIKCGGLQGMRRLLEPDSPLPVIDRLVKTSKDTWGRLSDFPYADIIRDISAFSHRKTRRQ